MQKILYKNGVHGKNVVMFTPHNRNAEVCKYVHDKTVKQLIDGISLTIFQNYIDVHFNGHPVDEELAGFHEDVLNVMTSMFNVVLKELHQNISDNLDVLLLKYDNTAQQSNY